MENFKRLEEGRTFEVVEILEDGKVFEHLSYWQRGAYTWAHKLAKKLAIRPDTGEIQIRVYDGLTLSYTFVIE